MQRPRGPQQGEKARHRQALATRHVELVEGGRIGYHWNRVRLHAGIGCVTPNDEHEGRGPAIRKAREAGLEAARLRRLTYHRTQHRQQPNRGPDDVV